MEEKDVIYLDTIDGFEFETVCQRIFEKYYGCQVEHIGIVGDEGRDLLIHHPEGLIVVECKHHPDSAIGRPIVQKLHSAVISSGSRNGIIVTTGTFSKQATEHSKKLLSMGVKIDLVDRAILADIAARAGIMIVVDGKNVPIWSYDVSDKGTTENLFAHHIDQLYESHPKRPSQLFQVQSRDIDLIPVYEVWYTMNASFETNVGIVHREIVPSGRFLIGGEQGMLLSPSLLEFYSVLPVVSFPVKSIQEWNPNSRPFSIGISELKIIASRQIIASHSRNVRYVGGNNQTYDKFCVPNSRQFTITNIRQLYFPVNRSRIRMLNVMHDLLYLEHPSGRLQVLNQSLSNCGICGTNVLGRPLLCNVCGVPIHQPTFFGSHSYKCSVCGKTICRSCARYRSKFLIFKDILCDECVIKYPPNLVRRFTHLSHTL